MIKDGLILAQFLNLITNSFSVSRRLVEYDGTDQPTPYKDDRYVVVQSVVATDTHNTKASQVIILDFSQQARKVYWYAC